MDEGKPLIPGLGGTGGGGEDGRGGGRGGGGNRDNEQGGGGGGGSVVASLGSAVQVEPMKPMLKPPETKRLKLRCGEPLSKFAFKFNLRRYSSGSAWTSTPTNSKRRGTSMS